MNQIIKSKTNKSHYSNIPIYKPSAEDKELATKTLLSRANFFAYKKLKTKYAGYCSWCNSYGLYTIDEIKQIRASGLCPKCCRRIRTTTQTQYSDRTFVMIGNHYGYIAYIKWQFNKEPKIKLVYCYYTQGDGVSYRKGIVRNMYSLGESKDTENWHKCDTYKYYGFFYSIKSHENHFYDVERTKKKLYESYRLPKMKSNQETLVKNGIFNENQIYYIVNFDLKSADEVIKYNAYIRNHIYESRLAKPLNIHFLNYLHKNNIDIRDFSDYVKDCEILNIKVDKPKDFQKKHIELSALAQEKKNKTKNARIQKRYKELSKHIYSKGELSIKPFKTYSQIVKAGKELHNCIATYINDYADKETDLYYLSKSNKLIACIEVNENELLQARENLNKSCTNKIIKEWCKVNNITYRKERVNNV